MPSPLGQIVIKFLADTKELKGGLSRASSLIRDFSLVATGATQAIGNAFRVIAEVGIKALTVSLAGLSAAFVLTAKSGADFEDNMVRTFAILQESAGATKADLAALTDEARRLGRDTLASGTQAAEGMMILARAGFDVSETLTATKSVIDLSIVGNMSVAESATAAASSMRGFGLQASDLARVNDVLAKASALANTDIQLLSSGLSFVAPLSRAAGISIEETATALDLLANAGIRGSRGGTTLRRMLSVLLAPTGRAKKAFDEMGLSFVNSEGKIDSISSALRKLEKAGLTAAQTMEIFGLRAGPGAAALLGAGSSAFDKLKAQIKDSEGAADRMSQAFRTSVKGRVLDLSASIKDLGLAFSEEFKKPLADTIFSIRNWIVNIVEALEKTGAFKAIISGLGEALSPIISRIKIMAKSFSLFLMALTPEIISDFFSIVGDKVEEFLSTLEENRKNIVDFFQAAVAPALFLIGVLRGIIKAFLLMPTPIQKIATAMAGLSAGILILSGGIVPLISLTVLLGLAFGPTRVAIFSFFSMVFSGIPITKAFTLAMAQLGKAILFTLKRVALISLVFIKWVAIISTVGLAIISLTAIIRGMFTLLTKRDFAEGFNAQFDFIIGSVDKLANTLPKKFKDMFKNMKGEVKSADLAGDMKNTVAKIGQGADAGVRASTLVDKIKSGKALSIQDKAQAKREGIKFPKQGLSHFALDEQKRKASLSGDKQAQSTISTRILKAKLQIAKELEKTGLDMLLSNQITSIKNRFGTDAFEKAYAPSDFVDFSKEDMKNPAGLATLGIHPFSGGLGAVDALKASQFLKAGKDQGLSADKTTEDQKIRNLGFEPLLLKSPLNNLGAVVKELDTEVGTKAGLDENDTAAITQITADLNNTIAKLKESNKTRKQLQSKEAGDKADIENSDLSN